MSQLKLLQMSARCLPFNHIEDSAYENEGARARAEETVENDWDEKCVDDRENDSGCKVSRERHASDWRREIMGRVRRHYKDCNLRR